MLIPTAEIEDVIADFQHGPFRFPDGVPGDRQCPCCVATLARFELFGMPLDRCEVHGVWFDARELVHVLEAATGVEPRSITDADKPPSTGLRRLLDRLFSHRWDYKRPRD